MDHNLHTIKITGHLTFDSRYKSFRSAFRDFIEDPTSEGIQLQVTDMVNADIPSMEIGAKISISRTITSVADARFAQADKTKPQVARKPVEKPVENRIKADKPVNNRQLLTVNGSDTCFY